jgi:hypothetical protein
VSEGRDELQLEQKADGNVLAACDIRRESQSTTATSTATSSENVAAMSTSMKQSQKHDGIDFSPREEDEPLAAVAGAQQESILQQRATQLPPDVIMDAVEALPDFGDSQVKLRWCEHLGSAANQQQELDRLARLCRSLCGMGYNTERHTERPAGRLAVGSGVAETMSSAKKLENRVSQPGGGYAAEVHMQQEADVPRKKKGANKMK